MGKLKRLALCLVLGWAFLTPIAHAQDTVGPASTQVFPVSLLADDVAFDSQNQKLVASGNVTILYQGRILVTDRIIYDQKENRIHIPSPLRFKLGEDTFLKADSAVLTDDLSDGLIQGARLLIANQLQIASAELHRTDDRFKVLYKTVASSCYVCPNNKVPFWQIRAKRIIHDEKTRQLFFEGARLEFLGIPVLYAPYFRTPDPTVKRATGFLPPTIISSTTLGIGYKQPFFIVLGDHADITITPFATSKGNLILEGEYRQHFSFGYLETEGAYLLKDNLGEDPGRSYFKANGQFSLPHDIQATLDIFVVSDKAFLADFGYGNQDRLYSDVTFERTTENQYMSASIAKTQSLRVNEVDSEIPLVLPELYFRRTWQDSVLGGTFGLTGQAVSLVRENDNDFNRFGLTADWRRNWIFSNGMVAETTAALSYNSFYTRNDPVFGSDSYNSTIPTLTAELRWPWSKITGGATHVIEPVVQVAWSPDDIDARPNEDSTQVEFEEGNLFEPNRFPGYDSIEQGLRANIGVNYWRYDPNGWNLGVTVGQVIRQKNLGQFSTVSGLSGKQSDFLAAFSVQYKDHLWLANRTLFDDDFSITKNETLIQANFDRWSVSASYLYQEADPSIVGSTETSEGSVLATYKFTDYWSGAVDWRHDFDINEPTYGQFDIIYENECVKVDLYYKLRYATSGTVEESRELGLTVELVGLGGSKKNRNFAKRCHAI